MVTYKRRDVLINAVWSHKKGWYHKKKHSLPTIAHLKQYLAVSTSPALYVDNQPTIHSHVVQHIL